LEERGVGVQGEQRKEVGVGSQILVFFLWRAITYGVEHINTFNPEISLSMIVNHKFDSPNVMSKNDRQKL